MKEIKDDIWKYYDQGNWICITTNGFVKNNGECVMGRGVALQCKQRFPMFPKILGDAIVKNGNVVNMFVNYRLITLPVKHNWWEKADLELIEKSIKALTKVRPIEGNIYLTRPGCHNGRLKWDEVKQILEKYLDDNFIVCDLKD